MKITESDNILVILISINKHVTSSYIAHIVIHVIPVLELHTCNHKHPCVIDTIKTTSEIQPISANMDKHIIYNLTI